MEENVFYWQGDGMSFAVSEAVFRQVAPIGLADFVPTSLYWWSARVVRKKVGKVKLVGFPEKVASWVLSKPVIPPTIPTPPNKKLLKHQRQAVAWLYWLWHFPMFTGGLLADEMGLGKTISAIAFANYLRPEGVLVVAPAHLLENWKKEISRWQTLGYETMTIRTSWNIQEIYHKFAIVSYASLHKVITDTVKHRKYTSVLVIADESHYIKNAETVRFKNIVRIQRALDILAGRHFTLLMTGTPMVNLADDLYPVWYLSIATNYRDISSLSAWNRRYIYWDRRKIGKKVVPVKVGNRRERELALRLSTIMLRRKKEDVLDLPDKVYQYLSVPVPSTLSQQFQEVLNTLQEKGQKVVFSEHIQHILQEIGLRKVVPAVDLIRDITLERGAVVVWAYHHSVIDALYEELSKKGLSVVKADGRDNDAVKQKAVEDFQKGKYDVFVAGLTAMNTGYTLTRANTTVFVQTNFTPADMRQAEDRIHRVGQDKDTLVIYLTASGTTEEAVLRKWLKKEAPIKRILDRERRERNDI